MLLPALMTSLALNGSCTSGQGGNAGGKLPEMPLGARVEAYSAPVSNFDGIITIAGPLSLSIRNRYYQPCQETKRAAVIFADLVNGRGGVSVGERKLGIQVAFVDDQSSIKVVGNATAYAIMAAVPTFMTSPFSAALTLQASLVSAANRKVMIGTTGEASAINGSNLTFSVYPPGAAFLPPSIGMLVAKATEANIKGSLRFGFVQENDPFSIAACASVTALAAQYGIVVSDEQITNIDCALRVSNKRTRQHSPTLDVFANICLPVRIQGCTVCTDWLGLVWWQGVRIAQQG